MPHALQAAQASVCQGRAPPALLTVTGRAMRAHWWVSGWPAYRSGVIGRSARVLKPVFPEQYVFYPYLLQAAVTVILLAVMYCTRSKSAHVGCIRRPESHSFSSASQTKHHSSPPACHKGPRLASAICLFCITGQALLSSFMCHAGTPPVPQR